ncbi:unnamed protein product [Clonostachys byssicola]|uniref:Uncharacterized protein n=1 Tax=Clonostachys byssicola TaxID=160290 RepID=A0A9N9Y216_9HYPO|nr:unnamed protein product [Clonostachys byssicola]
MSLQIGCGAGTPDSTSERARQTPKTIFDWTYDPVNRPYHGPPCLAAPYSRPEGFPVRLIAVGALGGYMGGFFLPAGDMILKTIDLELVPWTELHPSDGLSERGWIRKYVTPNFEVQIVSGCAFELGKKWSQHEGLLALPKQGRSRSAYDLFRPDSANAFEVKDGRVVVYVHFQIAEGECSNGCTSILRGTHGSLCAREAQWIGEDDDESMYDSDGPGSNYQRKRPLARPAQQPPVRRRDLLQSHNASSSDIDGSSGSSGDESGSSSGSDSNSDSGSDTGDDSGSLSGSLSCSLSGSGGSEDGSDLSSDSESKSESRHSPSPRAAERAPVKATKQAPVRAPPRAPADPNKQPAPRDRPVPTAEATRQPPSSQTANSRKRPRTEEGSGAVAPASGPDDSTVCIKIEDDAEEGNWAAGPAARTRGAASRRPAEKRARFSNGC